ncbi:MAG: serine hydrolase [Anaerolineae bacterium]
MPIEERIAELARAFSGTLGVAARRLDSDERCPEPVEGTIGFNARERFPTASCIKVPILVELFRQAKAGALDLGEEIVLRAEDQVPGTGVLKDLQPGLRLTLEDLATLAITVSDNTAANLLIDRVGQGSINARIAVLGMRDTYLGTKFVFDAPERNVGTPADFCRLLTLLARRAILDRTTCDGLLAVLSRQQYVDYIPRYLPFNRFAEEFGLPQEVRIANKVGMLAGVTNDMAVVALPTVRYVLVIFTRDCQDTRFGPDNEGARLVAEVSRLVYDHFRISSSASP